MDESDGVGYVAGLSKEKKLESIAQLKQEKVAQLNSDKKQLAQLRSQLEKNEERIKQA